MKIEHGILPYSDESGYEITLTLDDGRLIIEDEGGRKVALDVEDWPVLREGIDRLIAAKRAILGGKA